MMTIDTLLNRGCALRRRLHRSVLVALVFILTGLPAAMAAEGLDAEEYVLENGMTVLVSEMPTSPVVALNAMVKVGSATEGEYLGAGVSHFVEHLLFKGTGRRPAGAISQEIKSLGGNINASTSFDRTSYVIDVPAGEFERALDILADMLMNASFDPEEVEREREVIVSEMRMHRDNPDRQLSDLIFKTVYTRHPYQHPVIGYEPILRSVSRDELYGFYKKHYIPNNIILAVAGDIKANDVLPAVRAAFKDFRPRPYPMRNIPQEPDQITARRAELKFPTDLARLSLIYQGVSVLNKDMIPLDVLSVALGHGRSSRLYEEIYKKQQLVYSISTMNYTPMDRGLFEITSVLDEDKIPEAEAAIKEQLVLLKQKGITPAELEKAKTQVISQFVFNRQRASSVADELAINQGFTGDYDFSRGYIEGVRQVTNDDIKRVAAQYLRDSALSTVILRPAAETGQADSTGEEPVAEKPISKYTLDNGLTLLLRQDKTFPLVAMGLVMEGGVRQEDPALNGVANLTGEVWIKGTEKRSARTIAEQVEARGVRLDSFAGNNSLGLRVETLSDDFEFSLALMEELVEQPVFPEDELAKQIKLVRGQLKEQQNDVFAVTTKALMRTLFKQDPLGRPVLGSEETLDRITREDVRAYYRRLARPSNMVMYVFGDIDPEEVLAKVSRRFGDLDDQPADLIESFNEEPIDRPREVTETLNKEQAVVMIGFRAPAIDAEDYYPMKVLINILGAPLNGRVFLNIRDVLGESYRLGGYSVPGLDRGCAVLYVATRPESVTKVREALFEEVDKIRREPVSEEELASTKTYLIGTHAMSQETNASLAFGSALDELYGLGYDDYLEFDKKVNAVTAEQVQQAARRYLDPQAAVIVITHPPQPTETEAPRTAEND